MTEARYRWWDAFVINRHKDRLDDLNLESTYAAEFALERDPRNLMAYGLLARQNLTIQHGWRADTMWQAPGRPRRRDRLDRHAARSRRTKLLPDGVRGRRHPHLPVRPCRGVPSRSGRVPQFPGPDRVRFWEAWAGCLDPALASDAVVPWSAVRRIRSGNWVLWFDLHEPVTIVSDRVRQKRLSTLETGLHGATGIVRFYLSPSLDGDLFRLRTIGVGSAPLPGPDPGHAGPFLRSRRAHRAPAPEPRRGGLVGGRRDAIACNSCSLRRTPAGASWRWPLSS